MQAAETIHAAFEPRDFTLRDGRAVRVRAVLPSDEEEILQAFDRLDAEARYMRFMASVKQFIEAGNVQ